MFIVLVYVKVKPDFIEAFHQACLENAQNSVNEPGVARFDVIQELDDQTKFVLIEVYRTIEAVAHHKLTEHYERWRDRVADMMAEPRAGIKYRNLFPEDASW
jgi:quinol monooxygenase YgiN